MCWLRQELLHWPTIELRHLYTHPHYWHSSPGLYKNFGPCVRKFASEVTEIFRSLFLDIRNEKTENSYVTLCKILAGRARPSSPSSTPLHIDIGVSWWRGQLHCLYSTINDCMLIYSGTLERHLRSVFPLLELCTLSIHFNYFISTILSIYILLFHCLA